MWLYYGYIVQLWLYGEILLIHNGCADHLWLYEMKIMTFADEYILFCIYMKTDPSTVLICDWLAMIV